MNELTWFPVSVCLIRIVCSPRLDSQLHPQVAELRRLASRRSFNDLAVKTRGLRSHESQPGNNIPIPNMKRSSAKRNLVNVVLIDDRLHHWTIVICLRMITREELSLTDSAENCAFAIRLNENEGGAESVWHSDFEPWFTATGNANERTTLLNKLTDANWLIQTKSTTSWGHRRECGWSWMSMLCYGSAFTLMMAI